MTSAYPGFDRNHQNQPSQAYSPNQNVQESSLPLALSQSSPSLHSAKPHKPLWKRWWVYVLTVLVAATAAFLALIVLPAWRAAEHIDAGVDICKEKVTDWAKYPGGAEFAEVNIPEKISGIHKEYIVEVEGKVDFPNGFGAPVRQEFSCTITANVNSVDVSNVWVR